MRTFTVSNEDQGKRVDRYIQKKVPELSFPLLSKLFRKRDVKVNGQRVKENYIVAAGDRVDLYMPADLDHRSPIGIEIPVIYEDSNILVVNKPQGIPVQDATGISVEKILKSTIPACCSSAVGAFPALCHRLDRNTGGLLLLAKNQNALDIILEKFKNREIHKKYHCVVYGCPKKPYGRLEAFLVKNPEKSLVKIYPERVPGSVSIQTNYRILETTGELSLLEVELITGRTHQIRAHLARIGHPVLGDGKYGTNSINRNYSVKHQLLWSTSLQFDFNTDAGALNYLKGKTITLPGGCISEILTGVGFGH